MKIFRYGGLTLLMLGGLALAGSILLPRSGVRQGARPADTDTSDPRWVEARSWVDGGEERRLVVCPWPDDLPIGGRLDDASPSTPAFFDEGQLVHGVTGSTGGDALVAGSAVRAWVAWTPQACAILRARRVEVTGQVVRPDRSPVPGMRVTGCGIDVEADDEGRFSATLDASALRDAEQAVGGPRCALQAGGPATPVRLSEGGERSVLVQVGG